MSNTITPPKFHPGQKVTPCKKGPLSFEFGTSDTLPPALKFGEIYTVDQVFLYPDNVYGVTLCEIGRHISINENRLDPVDMTDESIEEIMKQSILCQTTGRPAELGKEVAHA